jgi:hypothetical protein
VIQIRRYLIKIDRIAAWVLFFLIILFFITGWNMTGKLVLIHPKKAQYLHLFICIPTLFVFLIHSGIRTYFAIKRWKLKK